MKFPIPLLLLGLFISTYCYSQDSTDLKLAVGYIDAVSVKTWNISSRIDSRIEKVLAAMKKKEEKIYRKLKRKDSTKAKEMLAVSGAKYEELSVKLMGASSKLNSYVPALDTIKTSLKFFSEKGATLSNMIGADKKIVDAFANISSLESSMNKAEIVNSFLKERKELITGQLSDLSFRRELKSLNKEVYYYSAQIKEYKALLKDKKKIEKKALAILVKSKLFQEFMEKHSYLASLFQMPQGNSTISLEGLQTRNQTNRLIQNQIATGGDLGAGQFAANIKTAQSELASLKSKVLAAGVSSEDLNMPDGFKPNSQKTKTFIKRLEIGGDLQTRKANNYFPALSDIGVTIGYKLTDKTTIGVGAVSKIGLGSNWENIKLNLQGTSLRSYFELKAKGAFWISANYERHKYMNLSSGESLSWQESGLIGISKKSRVGKKELKTQILFDFFAHRQVPYYSALQFRVGYKF